jgi:kumamolisin
VLRRRTVAEPPVDQRLSPAELAATYGAAPDDMSAVSRVLASHGIDVVASDPASRRVRIEGATGDLEALFGATLERPADGAHARMRSGELTIPRELDGVVTAVLGLDTRQQAQTRHVVAAPQATRVSYSPVELAAIYGMPTATGKGQTVAIIELGGGFAQSDLDAYFRGLGIIAPTVAARGVDGATNKPGQDPQGADGEVLLDIEVVGAIATEAEVVVYFAPNTDDGFLDAVATATHASPTPVAISISWGQSEDQWTAQSRTAMDQAFADAAALGITVTAAAGDNGSGDHDTSGGPVHADFPASSPHVLGCGGTTLEATDGTVTSEVVWDGGASGGATGGGVSDTFALPEWQQDAGVPERAGTTTTGRGVPDVAGNADPATGYQVYVDGQSMVIGGTSAVAPLWAGLVARIAETAGPLGLLQPRLYPTAPNGGSSTALRDITSGSNGAYQARVGWDACTGLGVPEAATARLWQA